MSQHSYLDPSDIEIVVANSEVTLQGSVDDRWAKRTAEELAESVPGVKQVHNQLRVSTASFGQDRTTQERTSQERPGQPRSPWAA
jgi:Flp pilus assembly secretin CpaC